MSSPTYRNAPLSDADTSKPAIAPADTRLHAESARSLRRVFRNAWDAIGTIDRWLASPRSPQIVVVALAAYLVAAANFPLWLEIARIGGAPSLYLRSTFAMAVIVAAGTTALLSFTAWTRGMRLVWLAVVAVAAVAQYYMLTYQMVMDPTMAANVLHTDIDEVRNLLGLRMLALVLAVLVLPVWWLLRLRLVPTRLSVQLGRNLILLALALVVASTTAVVFSRDLAPLMRNNPLLRYRINPLATFYSTGMATLRPLLQRKRGLIPIGQGAALGGSHAQQSKPPLMLLVIGETARADHFALNGYSRDTTPGLAAHQVFNWSQVRSCGTNTLASLPCMFSPLGKAAFESRTDDYENLLDVVKAAGMAVLWLDNQSGCKGVCDRVPHAQPSEALPADLRRKLCSGGECQDTAMLYGLSERLNALPAEQRARGVLLVMHQMGSHGPAYSKRSSAANKRFEPECRTEVLADCSHAQLVNAYDNSIAETDAFLSQSIDWVKSQTEVFDAGLLYISDHGESLGEYGLFLHGLPYALAPDVQKHVPMVAWLSHDLMKRGNVTETCLRSGADKPLTHDNLFHTVLGLVDVATPSYQPRFDALEECRHLDRTERTVQQ